MGLNPRTPRGLENISTFLWAAYRAKLITEHERKSLDALSFRLRRHIEDLRAPIDSHLRPRILHVDLAHGMQVALLMTYEFIRDRAKARLEETKDLIEVYDGNIFGQEAILREAIVTRDKLAEERNALQNLV
jgi:hypothetical protein